MTKTFTGYLTTDEFGFLCLVPNLEAYCYQGESLACSVEDAFKKGARVFVRYFITSGPATPESASEALIHKTFGFDVLEAEYVLEAYSEVTIEAWEENLKIGGHDLISELSSYEGKYLILVIEEFNDDIPHCL
jgi:hypothetical protein